MATELSGERRLIASGSSFEAQFGYSRAVRVGPWVCVAGCTAAGPDGPVGGDDVAAQTREALRRIAGALGEAGSRMQDVVRTRVFVAEIHDWQLVGNVHLEIFGDIRPASTIVEVSGFVDPTMLVEIEADALVVEQSG
ncbi:MAG TPA: RidA family protein [Actinophytocola sp.]|jgi:enamine deaminase RidA (YjgF/YER057c/UK114 family)|nr:RidA family protein [Actinophytocola sp.]